MKCQAGWNIIWNQDSRVHPYGRKWRETKDPLDKGERAGLKLNTKKMKITVSSPITLWQIEGGKVEAVIDFIFLGYKITADGDYSHEIKDAYSLEGKLWPTEIAYYKAETLLCQQRSI